MKNIYQAVLQSLSKPKQEIIQQFVELSQSTSGLLARAKVKMIFEDFNSKNLKENHVWVKEYETNMFENNIAIRLAYYSDGKAVNLTFKNNLPDNKYYNFDIVVTYNITKDNYTCALSYNKKSDSSYLVYARYSEIVNSAHSTLEIDDCYNHLNTTINSFMSPSDEDEVYIFSQTEIIETILNQYNNLEPLKEILMLTHDIKVEDDVLLKNLFDTLNQVSALKNKNHITSNPKI